MISACCLAAAALAAAGPAHGGGDVPMIMGRLYDYAPKNIAEKAPDGIRQELARLKAATRPSTSAGGMAANTDAAGGGSACMAIMTLFVARTASADSGMLNCVMQATEVGDLPNFPSRQVPSVFQISSLNG